MVISTLRKGHRAFCRYRAQIPFRVVTRRAFTLVELLVSIAVIALFAVLLASVTDNTFELWSKTRSDVNSFESARAAYDAMTRRISQATLNTYLDYYDQGWNRRVATDTTFVPSRYGRASDLHFLSGDAATILGGDQQGHGIFFFAPLGFTDNSPDYADLPNLLNAIGYFVEWGTDSGSRPAFLSVLPERRRFRLMEVIQPSQAFTSYPALTDDSRANDVRWIEDASEGLLGPATKKHALAENIIALIIRPEVPEQDADLLGLPSPESLTANYVYDSRAGEDRSRSPDDIQFAQLPPLLRVIMVAVSEKDAVRLTTSAPPPPALQLNPNWFKDPSRLDDDLQALGKQLTDAGIQFRTFNQVIPIRGAKFSAKREN